MAMRILAPLNSEPIPTLQQVEIATFFQLPSFHIIGLPCPEVAEAKERVRSAIEASGLEFPKRRVILNLSPASIRKRGTGLDLAMALGVLSTDTQSDLCLGAWGELGLDGAIKPVGQLTRSIYAAWQGNVSHLFISALEYVQGQDALECIERSQEFVTPPPCLVPVSTLREAWNLLKHNGGSLPSPCCLGEALPSENDPSGNEMNSNESGKVPTEGLLPLSPALERIIGAATAGQHHILLLGPRGAGKSHALEWLIALQPSISYQNRLQQRLLREMNSIHTHISFPVRRVSSQVKPGALLGGATSGGIRPGEVSLAHGGLLIADELPEWARDSREALREPLERGRVTLTRTQGSLELPSQFLLAANGNLCPCGGWPKSVSFPEGAMSGLKGVSSRDSGNFHGEKSKNK